MRRNTQLWRVLRGLEGTTTIAELLLHLRLRLFTLRQMSHSSKDLYITFGYMKLEL